MARPTKPQDIIISGVELMGGRFSNFEGRKEQFNDAGKRNINIRVPDEMVSDLVREGWNVKMLRPREEGDEPAAILKININENSRQPPRIVLITNAEKREGNVLPPEAWGLLDHALYDNVDIKFSAYAYERNGEWKFSAWLQAIYLTLHYDKLALKYRDYHMGGNRPLEIEGVPEEDFSGGEVLEDIVDAEFYE